MKILFHIGMGKTGTTSIQHALRSNLKELEYQGFSYLGMWFNSILPQYGPPNGVPVFFNEPPETQVENAKRFFDVLLHQAEQKNTQKFIFSNECIFEFAELGRPFFDELRKHIDIDLLAYIRDPASWLPSAYAQWGLRHKRNEGPIQPFGEAANRLVKIYNHAKPWHQQWGKAITFRKFDKSVDSVADFASFAGINLPVTTERVYQRDPAAESLLRGVFNNRYSDPVMPNSFTKIVYNSDIKTPIKLRDFAARNFDYSSLNQVIEDNKNIFEYLNSVTDLNIEYRNISPPNIEDFETTKEGLIDHLVDITISQSLKIEKLEKAVALLQEKKQ